MKNCKYCSAPLDDDSLFCANCGKKVEPQGKTCPQCGAEVEDDSVFCAKCGMRLDAQIVAPIDSQQIVTPSTPLQEEEEVVYEWEEEKDRTWWYVIGGIVVAAILVFGGYYLYMRNNKRISASNVEREPIALKGKINETIGFSMELNFEGDEIEGTEHYDKQKEKDTLSIKGTIDENGNMVLREYDNNIECGIFNGVLSDNVYSGTFTLHGKNMSFSAQVLRENYLEKKKETILNKDDIDEVNIDEDDKLHYLSIYSQLLDKYVNERQSDEYMDETYFLYDITGDKKPELWLEVTDWEGEYFHLLYVYTVSNGQMKLLYKGNGGHPAHHIYYKGKNYILMDYSYMESYGRYKYEYNGGRIVIKELFSFKYSDDNAPEYNEPTESKVITSDISDKELLNSL